MRTSERFAAGAVALMIAPAFLAFPALGVWGVMHVWPSLTAIQHLWFWLSLAMLGFTLPYVSRRHLDVVWRGQTRKPSWFEESLILIPLAVGLWSLTGNWAAAFALLCPKLFLWLMRILDALTGRSEPVNVRTLTEPDESELSPVSWLAMWVTSRRRTRAKRQTITMTTRRARSRRDRGR